MKLANRKCMYRYQKKTKTLSLYIKFELIKTLDMSSAPLVDKITHIYKNYFLYLTQNYDELVKYDHINNKVLY